MTDINSTWKIRYEGHTNPLTIFLFNISGNTQVIQCDTVGEEIATIVTSRNLMSEFSAEK